MRRTIKACALLLLLLILPTLTAGAARRQTVCDRRGTTTTANARARIFFVSLGFGDRTDYGCARRGGRVRELAIEGGGAELLGQLLPAPRDPRGLRQDGVRQRR